MRLSEAKLISREDPKVFTPEELESMVQVEFDHVVCTDYFIKRALTSQAIRIEQFETFLRLMEDVVIPNGLPLSRRSTQLQMCEDFLLTTYRLQYTSLAELQLEQYVASERKWQGL